MSSEILQKVKAARLRLTPTRKTILDILDTEHTPIDIPLLTKRLGVHKTTVYRELESLLRGGIVKRIDFGDRKLRYELASTNHHHHLVCIRCQSVQDITLEESFENIAVNIQNEQGFTVHSHSLEFFGMCARCQKGIMA